MVARCFLILFTFHTFRGIYGTMGISANLPLAACCEAHRYRCTCILLQLSESVRYLQENCFIIHKLISLFETVLLGAQNAPAANHNTM